LDLNQIKANRVKQLSVAKKFDEMFEKMEEKVVKIKVDDECEKWKGDEKKEEEKFKEEEIKIAKPEEKTQALKIKKQNIPIAP
jgi:hypothetical protein